MKHNVAKARHIDVKLTFAILFYHNENIIVSDLLFLFLDVIYKSISLRWHISDNVRDLFLLSTTNGVVRVYDKIIMIVEGRGLDDGLFLDVIKDGFAFNGGNRGNVAFVLNYVELLL